MDKKQITDAVRRYLEVGGDPDFVIMSRTSFERENYRQGLVKGIEVAIEHFESLDPYSLMPSMSPLDSVLMELRGLKKRFTEGDNE